MQTSLEDKRKRLTERLRTYQRLAVALSGGVDSALLLAEAADVLGGNLLAVTARSPIHPQQELADAARVAADLGVPHMIVDSDEMEDADFLANPPERCYICKKHVFGQLLVQIREKGFQGLAHGANADDLDDYRPGLQAARELGVVAPLMDAGFTKRDIRLAARQRGLHVWDKPAMACLATRFPYGTPIVSAHVEQVHRAEAVLARAGFDTCRVRRHGEVARIEVPSDRLGELFSDPLRAQIAAKLRDIGFAYVCADLEGHVSGSMNRSLYTGNHAAAVTTPSSHRKGHHDRSAG